MTGSVIYDAIEISNLVREKRPDLKIIFGGVHSSLLPEETVKNPFIDIVVIGPGEDTAVNLAQAIRSGSPIETISGIAYKKDGGVVVNPRTTALNKDRHSGIDYRMVDLSKYIKREAAGDRSLDYLSSRGCPHPCTYCAISKLWDKKIIYYPPEKMADDIESFVREYGINTIHFLDDNFFVNRKRVEVFCDEVIKRRLKLHFWSWCRCNYFARFDDDFLAKLKKAGFYTFNFGAESGSQFILDRIKKGITVQQIEETAVKCDRFGFRGQFSFMMGFPFERDEDTELTMKLMDSIHSINPAFDMQLYLFLPFPQTELAAESMEYGYVPPDNLEYWAKFDVQNMSMPWIPLEKRKQNEILTTIAWVAFTNETAIKLGGAYAVIYRFFGKVARFRWKHRLFVFPLEWRLVKCFSTRQ